MKIDVANIKKETGASATFNVEGNLQPLNVYGGEMRFKNPVKVGGEAVNTGKTIMVKGTVKAEYEAECTRCLETYSGEIELSFSQEYQVSDQPLNDDIVPFTGDIIDITNTVKNTIILGAPMKLLCSSGCKGLCPSCGCNLNKTTCTCKTNNIDPRLSILKKLLK